MPIGYVRRAAQQRLQMTRRRSACEASIRPSTLWQHEVARGRHALVRRLDCASQHLDHPPDLRLRGDEERRHGDDVAGEAKQHAVLHGALEHPECARAGPGLPVFAKGLELYCRDEADVADVQDARLALQRMRGALEHGLELAHALEGSFLPDYIE